MERDCNKCVHHISGSCDAWECHMETLEDYRGKVIDETCLKIFNHLLIEIEWNRVLVEDWDALAEDFKDIAERLKGGAE